MDEGVVQSLWLGDRLTTMERLAISAFLRCGHTFHLYCYNPIKNVPDHELTTELSARRALQLHGPLFWQSKYDCDRSREGLTCQSTRSNWRT